MTQSFRLRLRRAVVALVLSALVAAGGYRLTAQTFTHNTTTTAAAQAVNDTTLSLTAVTAATGSSFGAVQVGQFILVEQEMELVTALASTTATVTRGINGGRSAHPTGAPVYIGSGISFQGADPTAGACTVANQPRWWINRLTGSVFTCATNGIWGKSAAPWYAGLNSGNGATVTLTSGQAGQTFLFDRAAGIVYTLPPPYPGMTFDFITTVTITSNAATVVTNAGTQFVVGVIHTAISGGATGSDWACNGTTHVKVTSNGTTSGGILGSRLHFTAASTTLWQVDGLLIGSGTEITPCST